MIITIKQNEIIDAIKQYLCQSGISVADNAAVEMTSTRGADGVTATIDLGATKAESDTGCGSDSSRSVLPVSGESEPENDTTEPEKEETPFAETKETPSTETVNNSLFANFK